MIFALKQIKVLLVSNLFPLEVVQKCQRYKLCVFEQKRPNPAESSYVLHS